MAERLTSIEPLKPLLKAGRLGVFSDIDGTLAPIVDNPDDARVSARNRELLGDLLGAGVVVAAITGRTLERARLMTGVEGIAYGANHGMTLSIDGSVEMTDEVAAQLPLAVRAAEDLRRALPGFLVEHTGPNVAIHYRTAADARAARDAILEAISRSEAASLFLAREGRKVFELRPRLGLHKGTAVATLAERLRVQAVLALGDDVTDIDMFQAARVLGARGMPVAIVAVKSEEAVPEVLEAADYWVDGVEGVEWLLAEVLKAVKAP